MLLEQVAAPEALRAAWRKLASKKPGPGVDRVGVAEFGATAEERIRALGRELLDGTYRPMAVLRHYPRDDPGRPLAIPTLRDRVVQRALAGVLGPLVEPTFSEAAWAYRPGRSLRQAVGALERTLESGLRFFVRSDVEAFFDRIEPDRLLDALAPDVPDPRVLRLVERFVRHRVLEGVTDHAAPLGVPQGSALSPLLSNVYLRPFDRAVLGAGYPLLRYADDLLVLCARAEETAAALELMQEQAAALGLRLGPRKTQRGHLGEGFEFLGWTFGPDGRGPCRGAVRALRRRAVELLADDPPSEEALDTLRQVTARWQNQYGTVAVEAVDGPELLLGCLLQGDQVGPERLRALVQRRRCLPAKPHAPGLHLELAAAWAALGEPEGLLLDAAEAVAAGGRGIRGVARERLVTALALPQDRAGAVLDGLAHAPVGLAEALVAAGRGSLAALVRAGLFDGPGEGTSGAAGAAGGRAVPGDPVPALAARLATLICGHPSRHGTWRADRRGGRRPFPEDGPLVPALWERHLAGLGQHLVFPLRADARTSFGMLRIYVPRAAAGPVELDPLLPPLLADTVARIRHAAESLGVVGFVERSAAAERRIWLPLAEPLPVGDVRALAVRLANAASPLPPPVQTEVFPAADSLRAPGPMLSLPLYDWTSGRSALLDRSGEPLASPLERLLGLDPTPRERVVARVRRGPLAPDRAAAQGVDLRLLLRKLPRALHVVAHCAPLARLIEKAEMLHHLDGTERQSLFELLPHLPGEGPAVLERVLLPHGIVSPAELRRRVAARCERPVSCARLRSRHARLPGATPCACDFGRCGPGAYPTPLLHTLRFDELFGRRRTEASPAPRRSRPARPSSAEPLPRQAAAPAPAPAPATAPAPGPAPARPPAAPGLASPGSSPGPQGSPAAAPIRTDGQDLSARLGPLVERYRRLREHLQGVSRASQRCIDEILAVLTESGLEAVTLDGVRLRRLPGGPQGQHLKVELPAPAAGRSPASSPEGGSDV